MLERVRGISVKDARGVGDLVQYSSVPENYFRETGKKLVDVDRSWIFDHNPFVLRDVPLEPHEVFNLWNFAPIKYKWPIPGDDRPPVYQSNAEIWALALGIKSPKLIRPRLYQFEDFPYHQRRKILLHTDGRSHGKMPQHVVDHLVQKYLPTGNLFLIGKPENTFGLPYIETPTLWDLAKVCSEAAMLVGCDSGPSWIAACYPDVVIKKVRTRPGLERYERWTPLEVKNHHAHWDDRIMRVYIPDEHDRGPFESYRKM